MVDAINDDRFMQYADTDPRNTTTHFLLDGAPYDGPMHPMFSGTGRTYYTGVRHSETSQKLVYSRRPIIMPAALDTIRGEGLLSREARPPKSLETVFQPIIFLEDVYGQQGVDPNARLASTGIMPQRRPPFNNNQQPFIKPGVSAFGPVMRRVRGDASAQLVPSSDRFMQLPPRQETFDTRQYPVQQQMAPPGVQPPPAQQPLPPPPGTPPGTPTPPPSVRIEPMPMPRSSSQTPAKPDPAQSAPPPASGSVPTPLMNRIMAGPSASPEEEVERRFERMGFPRLTADYTDRRKLAQKRIRKYQQLVSDFFVVNEIRMTREEITRQLAQRMMVPEDMVADFLNMQF